MEFYNIIFCHFNPRSLAGATLLGVGTVQLPVFQSTLPCGSDPPQGNTLIVDHNFNPRSLAGATTYAVHTEPSAAGFQSTLPCGSDCARLNGPFLILISIHAPLRERLSTINSGLSVGKISIHAPLRERPTTPAPSNDAINFNPRSLAGATMIMELILDNVEFQSTLPHGSDPPPKATNSHKNHFNPRSLTGATFCSGRNRCRVSFQSTLPHGSDSLPAMLLNIASNFNPRSLTGATITPVFCTCNTCISIHAPSRERH